MSPLRSDVLIAPTVASSARPAAAFEMSAWRAMASIISDLFTKTSFLFELATMQRLKSAGIGMERAHVVGARMCSDYIALAFCACQGSRDKCHATTTNKNGGRIASHPPSTVARQRSITARSSFRSMLDHRALVILRGGCGRH